MEIECDDFLNFSMLDLAVKHNIFELVNSKKEFNFLYEVFNMENKNSKSKVSNSGKKSLQSRLSNQNILENIRLEKAKLFQINYTFFYEKIPLVTKIVINFLENNKYKDSFETGIFPKVLYLSNNNDFSFNNLLDFLQKFLINKYGIEQGQKIYNIINKNFILIKSYSAIDFILNLIHVKALIKKDYLIKLIIIDTINDFIFKENQLLNFRKKLIGRKTNSLTKKNNSLMVHKIYYFLNHFLSKNINILEFHQENFYKEDLLKIDNNEIKMERKLFNSLKTSDDQINLINVYLLNSTYNKFIEEYLELSMLDNIEKDEKIEYRILIRFNNFCDQKISLVLYSINLDNKEFEFIQEECLDNVKKFDHYFEKEH